MDTILLCRPKFTTLSWVLRHVLDQQSGGRIVRHCLGQNHPSKGVKVAAPRLLGASSAIHVALVFILHITPLSISESGFPRLHCIYMCLSVQPRDNFGSELVAERLSIGTRIKSRPWPFILGSFTELLAHCQAIWGHSGEGTIGSKAGIMSEEIEKHVVQEQEHIDGALGEKSNSVCVLLYVYASILLFYLISSLVWPFFFHHPSILQHIPWERLINILLGPQQFQWAT